MTSPSRNNRLQPVLKLLMVTQTAGAWGVRNWNFDGFRWQQDCPEVVNIKQAKEDPGRVRAPTEISALQRARIRTLIGNQLQYFDSPGNRHEFELNANPDRCVTNAQWSTNANCRSGSVMFRADSNRETGEVDFDASARRTKIREAR